MYLSSGKLLVVRLGILQYAQSIFLGILQYAQFFWAYYNMPNQIGHIAICPKILGILQYAQFRYMPVTYTYVSQMSALLYVSH